MKKEKMIQMIAQERSKLGLSTYAAAEKAGINQSTWHRVEAGEIDASGETLFSMAGAGGLSVNISIIR